MHRPTVVLSALAAATIATSAGASASDVVDAYGISKFGGANECGSPSMTHSAHVKSAAAFTDRFQIYESLSFWGPWLEVNDTGAGSDYFTDPSKSASCNCSVQDDNAYFGFDRSQVAYVHTHGGHDTTSNGGKGESWYWMGNSDSGNTCTVSTHDNFLLGNASGGGRLEIATMKACEGADYTVWKSGGYRGMVPSTSRLQIFNGFHGDSSCGDFVADYVGDYAAESFADGVGENWIDEAYNGNGSGDDDCPVTIMYGPTPSSRKNMFYSGGFLDRKLTSATKSGSSYAFIGGCNPSGGVTLPQ